MATEKQIAANRRNSRNCTGPKTREGKFKSSLNALRHGLYSHNFIIKTEDADTFENFSKSFIDEFKPSTPSELENLKVLIITAWRRNRVTELMQLRINNAIDAVIAESEPTPAAQITLLAFDKLENEKPSFARQEAHEIRLVNLFQRTQRRLEASQDRKIRNETNLGLNSLSLAA
jgi:hypothetical protein